MSTDSDSEEVAIMRGHRTAVPAAQPSDQLAPSLPQSPPPTKKPPRPRTALPKEKKQKKEVENPEQYAYETINQMKEIYKKDWEANREGRPSALKIDSVEEIADRILRREAQDALINLGVLDELKKWLEPLPDKSLPSRKVKRTLLELLLKMHLTRGDLVRSGIGKIVYFYSRASQEPKDVRKLAGALVHRWKDVILREELEDN